MQSFDRGTGLGERQRTDGETKDKNGTLTVCPLAFMILLLMTSAGEHTVVATVPCFSSDFGRLTKCASNSRLRTTPYYGI